MDFSGDQGSSRAGFKFGGAKTKSIGLWVGAGLAAVALLVTALVLVLNSGGDQTSPAGPVAADASTKVISVALQPGSMELEPGQKRKFMVAVQPQNAASGVRWESADPSIASVQDGEVWGQKSGQTRIKVISLEDPTKTGIAEVIVSGSAVVTTESTPLTEPKPSMPRAVTPVTPKPVVPKADPVAVSNAGSGSPESDFLKTPGEKPAAAKPVAGKAILTITSAPPFAEVIVDGRFIGTTPVKDKELPTGKHKLQITHRSFPSIDTVIFLSPGAKSLRFRLFH